MIVTTGLQRCFMTILCAKIPPTFPSTAAVWPMDSSDEAIYQQLTSQYRAATPKVLFSMCQAAAGVVWNVHFQQYCSVCSIISTNAGSQSEELALSSDLIQAYDTSTQFLLFLLRLKSVGKVN
jgi:hypothetical protein